jgi:hypothetical protein
MSSLLHQLKVSSIPALLKKPGKHRDGGGLYLQVARRDVASWVFQCSFPGRPVKWMSIGPYNVFSLAEARERHRKLRQMRADGIDPIKARLNGSTVPVSVPVIPLANGTPLLAAGKPFGVAVGEYMAGKLAKWKGGARGSTYREYQSTLTGERGAALAPLVFEQITPDVVSAFVAPLSAKDQRETRGRIGKVTEYMRTGVIDDAAPPVQHFKAMPYKDVPPFMATLRATEGPAARILAFTILTAARIGEVVGDKYGKPAMTWGEIEGDVWTVPAARMKKGKEHRVPLSAAAFAYLGPRGADGDKVFPVGMTPVDKLRRKLVPNATTHGFRSSFKDWCGDESVDDRLSEAALSHYEGGTYGAYARGDLFNRRRELMDKWAAFCGSAS